MKASISAGKISGIEAGKMVQHGSNSNPILIGGIWNDSLLWNDNDIWKD